MTTFHYWCQECGREFVSHNYHRKFCSIKCSSDNIHRRPDFIEKQKTARHNYLTKQRTALMRSRISSSPILKYSVIFHFELPDENGKYVIHKDLNRPKTYKKIEVSGYSEAITEIAKQVALTIGID